MAWTFGGVVLVLVCFDCVFGARIVRATLEPPPGCTGFCTTKPEGYDELIPHIEKSIRESKLIMPIEDRWGPERQNVVYGGDSRNCRYKTSTFRPYSYVNHETNENFIIAQSDELLWQVVNETKCLQIEEEEMLSDNKQCFSSELSSEFSTSCEEKYIDIALHIFNVVNRTLEKVHMPVSVWCSCHLSITYNNK